MYCKSCGEALRFIHGLACNKKPYIFLNDHKGSKTYVADNGHVFKNASPGNLTDDNYTIGYKMHSCIHNSDYKKKKRTPQAKRILSDELKKYYKTVEDGYNMCMQIFSYRDKRFKELPLYEQYEIVLCWKQSAEVYMNIDGLKPEKAHAEGRLKAVKEILESGYFDVI